MILYNADWLKVESMDVCYFSPSLLSFSSLISMLLMGNGDRMLEENSQLENKSMRYELFTSLPQMLLMMMLMMMMMMMVNSDRIQNKTHK